MTDPEKQRMFDDFTIYAIMTMPKDRIPEATAALDKMYQPKASPRIQDYYPEIKAWHDAMNPSTTRGHQGD